MAANQDRWTVKDVVEEMKELKELVLGFKGEYPTTSIPPLKRIRAVVESVLKEIKDVVRYGHFDVKRHPLPLEPNFSWEPQPDEMIPYIIEMIDVFVSDFNLMKIQVNSEDPRRAHESVVFFRKYLDRFRSRTLKVIRDLVCAVLMAQKPQKLYVKIWSAKSATVNSLLKPLVHSCAENPNHLESIEKLKRIQQFLCDVINDARDFFLKNSFMPKEQGFPLAEAARVLEESAEHSPCLSLMRQHKSHAWDLVDVVWDCFEVLEGDYRYSLNMKELEEVSGFVTAINSVLVEKAVEEGGVYPDVLP